MTIPKLALSAAMLALAAPALAGTPDRLIALSDNYAGNSWRQAMLEGWEKVTSQAVADRIMAAADAFTAEDQATERAAQIQNLVLEG
jgi:ribose transport system substrate-binding protein